MKKRVNITTVITNENQLDELSRLSDIVELIEVRADLLGDIDAVKNATNIPLVYMLRSKDEGGEFDGSAAERRKLLITASTIFDFVELEGERDLIPELLDVIPKEKRRITWQGTPEDYNSLYQRLQKYLQVPASLYKIVVKANNHGDAIPVMHLLRTTNTKQLVAYAVGKFAEWTQILAPFLGAPEVPSVVDNLGKLYPYFSPVQLMNDYDLPYVYPIEQLFGIVGNPVLRSISPNQHNMGYRTLGLPYLYLPFHTHDFPSFMKEIMQIDAIPLPLKGLTVVAPFKREGYLASKYKVDKNNSAFGVCNGMIRKNKDWQGYSTDASGAIEALNRLSTNWKQKKIAIIGCGGTGRTIAFSLKKMNKNITLVNRTHTKGKEIAADLDLPFIALDKFDPSYFDIIIHATPLGKNQEETPFKITQLKQDSVVIDHIYTKEETSLVRYCRLCNIKVMDGIEIAGLQIKEQFKFLTGIEKPVIKETIKILK